MPRPKIVEQPKTAEQSLVTGSLQRAEPEESDSSKTVFRHKPKGTMNIGEAVASGALVDPEQVTQQKEASAPEASPPTPSTSEA